MGQKTFYDVLQVSPGADPEIIKAAYLSLAQRYHPDKNPGNPDVEKYLKIINRAFEVLSDPAKRARYDAVLTADSGTGTAQVGASSQSSPPSPEPEETKVVDAGGSEASSGQRLGQQASIQNNSDESDCSGYEYAGFGERLAALFLDGYVLLALTVPVLIFLIFLISYVPHLWIGGANQWVAEFSLYLVSWTISVIYFSVMESGEKSATYGKRWMGLKVLDVDRQRISGWRAFARWLSHFLSNITLCIGYFIQPFTQRKQALHDLASGTVVVQATHEKKSPAVVIAVAMGAPSILFLIVGFIASIAIPAYQDYQKQAVAQQNQQPATSEKDPLGLFSGGASDASIEEYARGAANGANTLFQKSPPNDGITISERAYAQGKAIVYEFVLAIRPDVTEAELAAWRAGTRSEVVPGACSVLRNDKFFNKGLHFRYRYLKRSGQVLDDFLVNRPACEVLVSKAATQDHAEAVKWYRLAAAQGIADAQFGLGVVYYDGRGVAQDYAEAVKWFRLAADQGNAAAQFHLGVMYEHGRGVAQDYAEAGKWFRLAATQGYAAAQNNLGMRYYHGQGVAQDYAEAVKWFRLAADQGNAAAQNNLGVVYEQGRGVALDYAEAVKWYRLAAAQGYAAAQYNLGVMYYHGRGMAQNYAEAVKWFRLAADQGNAAAQNNLGVVYEQGRGVALDFIRAYLWYNLAASQGVAKAVKNRDSIAERMPPQQIAQAQKMTTECQQRNFKNCD